MKQTASDRRLLFFVTLAVALWALGVFDRREPSDPAPSRCPGAASGGHGDGELACARGPSPRTSRRPRSPSSRGAGAHPPARGHASLVHGVARADVGLRARPSSGRRGTRTPCPRACGRTRVGARRARARADGARPRGACGAGARGFDPASMPAEFWARVADRVKSGSLGLLVIADNRFTEATGAEPSLASVLPVRGVKAVVPMTHGQRRPPRRLSRFPRRCARREAGTGHPATRLISWPGLEPSDVGAAGREGVRGPVGDEVLRGGRRAGRRCDGARRGRRRRRRAARDRGRTTRARAACSGSAASSTSPTRPTATRSRSCASAR